MNWSFLMGFVYGWIAYHLLNVIGFILLVSYRRKEDQR